MSSPTIKTHRSLETLQWQIMLGISGKALPLTGGSASLISLSGAPLPGVVFHSRTTSKIKTPSLRVFIGFTFITQPGVFLRNCTSPFLETNPIPGIRTTMTLGIYKRLCSEFGVSPDTDRRQKRDHGCQGLRSWSKYMTPSHEEYRHSHQAQHGISFHPMDAIRHNRDISAAWTTFVLDKSDGFTQASVTRLNDSIRTYV